MRGNETAGNGGAGVRWVGCGLVALALAACGGGESDTTETSAGGRSDGATAGAGNSTSDDTADSPAGAGARGGDGGAPPCLDPDCPDPANPALGGGGGAGGGTPSQGGTTGSGAGGSSAGGSGAGGNGAGGNGAGGSGGSSDPGCPPGECCVPAPSCPYQRPELDREHRASCAAHEVALAVDPSCRFNDDTLSAARCARVEDEVCVGQEHWYRLELRARRVFAVVPDGDHVRVEVFVASTPASTQAPASPDDLSALENGWGPSPFNYHRMYVIDAAADAPTSVWLRVTSPHSSGYELAIKESDAVLDCVGPRLTGRGAEYGYDLPGSSLAQGAFLGGLFNLDPDDADSDLRFKTLGSEIRQNSTACIKELNDPTDASKGWAVMQAVACVNGELQVLHDCNADFPAWGDARRAQYGELLCNLDVHPAGRLWCEPERQRDDDSAICALHGLSPGRATCLPDPLTGDSRYLFGCQSNHGFLFEDDPSLYDPRDLEERGYPTGVDCQDLRGESGPAVSEEELSRGRCGVDALMGETRCLFDREQAVLSEAERDASFDQFGPTGGAPSDFPETQNLVSCANPGEANAVGYTTIDPFSGIYTDAHVSEVAPQIAALKARGIASYGYLNVPSPETKTTWKDARFLGNSAPWASMGYQYLYWMDRLGADLGDPGTNYRPVPRRCIDADGDGFDNASDNCPLVYNRGIGGLQPDADSDGLGDACDPEPNVTAASDLDGDGVGQFGFDDNCPATHNPPVDGKQPDADNDGIGDACQATASVWTCDAACQQQTDACGPAERDAGTCQSSPLGTCDPSADGGVACLDERGTPRPARPLSWVFDLYQPVSRNLMIGWTKLAALAGLDGMTYDVATPPECYGDALNAELGQFLANRGHLERDLAGSTDPNDQSRLALYADVVAEVGDPSGLDVGPYRASLSDVEWSTSAVRRAILLFNVDFMRRFMRTVRDEMAAFMAGIRPGESFGTFFNQGQTTLYSSEEDESAPSGFRNLKSIAGAETFIRGGHPTHGLYDCVGVEGAAYPAQRTLEWLHALHDGDGMRFWSWNFPGEIPDDRWLLFAAEVLSHGGIAQTPFCSIEPNYPYSGYTTPNHVLRRALSAIGPWMTEHWSRLSLPPRPAQIAFYVPQTMEESCYASPQFGFDASERLYDFLRELNYTVDVISGSGFGMGRTRVPDPAALSSYDFVVLSAEFLSDAEIDAFETYLSSGGTLVSTGLPGRYDEWCEDRIGERASWLAHFDSHGENAVGAGSAYWLDGVEAYARPDTLAGLESRGALEFLHRPNAGASVCTPGGASCGDGGGTFDTSQLVVQDLPGERSAFRGWLETTLLDDFALPAPEFGTDLPADVHVSVRQDESGLPVYHLVNYALEAVPVDPWFDGDSAGSYESRVAHFGCTLARTVPALPVPPELLASGGTLHFSLLDQAPASDGFFPNACGPAAPCSAAPLAAEYPSADNGFAFPGGSVAIAPGQSEVVPTFPGGAPVSMKQWLVAWFEAASP